MASDVTRTGLFCIVVLGILAPLLCLPVAVEAHGAKIDYTIAASIEIVAKYDSGEPMAGAQVTIYAPDDPSEAWQTGTCDAEGRFGFTPDTSIPGVWDVQVRQAGHGDMIHIEVGQKGRVTGGDSGGGYSTGQIVLMSVCVVWGLFATALYFRGRRQADAHS